MIDLALAVLYVPGKRLWALAAQAPKIEGGRLHGSHYPRARVHPGCEVSCHAGGTKSTCIVASSVLRRGQPDSRENCIVLQSGPTRSLVDKFPQRSVVACSTQILCCSGRRCERGCGRVCANFWCLMLIVALKTHQNNRSYVSSVDLPSDSLRKNLAWRAVTP